MFEEFRKQSIKKSISLVVFLIAIGVVLLCVGLPTAIGHLKGSQVFEELAPEEIKPHTIVDLNLKYNCGGYMEEYEKNKSTGRTRTTYIYYVIWTGDEFDDDYRYISIKVPASYESQMEDMAEGTYNHSRTQAIAFSGEVQKMSNEDYEYYKEYFMDAGYTEAEFEEMTLPYHIVVGDMGVSRTVHYLFSLAGIVIIAATIIYFVRVIGGSKLKTIKKEIAAAGYNDYTAESDYASASQILDKPKMRLGRVFLYFYEGATPHALMKKDIVWVYYKETVHRTNGIKTGTTYALSLNTKSGKQFMLDMPKKDTVIRLIESLSARLPWIVAGYTNEVAKMYNKDRQAFLDLRYNKMDLDAFDVDFPAGTMQ